ncbi:hypothetical protein TNCV_3100971 [Trichonephila clavipes]|nr:hypothetical protein TNCV_3100971 [Trichonephila clavipes]
MADSNYTCEQGHYFLGTQDVLPDKEVLKQRVKMICEDASIIVACDHPPQDNKIPQFTGRYYTPHHHRTPLHVSRLKPGSQHERFYRCSTDEHTFDGLE